ncbi:hypothetical protein LM900558_120387 [Listeria monocytogenes]|nr:hypothetical protein LM900558_120387 [Listeria monocytogenes]
MEDKIGIRMKQVTNYIGPLTDILMNLCEQAIFLEKMSKSITEQLLLTSKHY